jgi:hypothetical protein
MSVVDRLDRRLGISEARQDDAHGLGEAFVDALQELDPVMPGMRDP